MRIALVGTGNMGNRFGNKLLEGGFDLAVFDIRQEAARTLVDAGAKWVGSPREAFETADLLITSLANPAAVRDVVYRESNGALAGAAPGKVFIDMSTSPPTLSREIAESFSSKAAEALDAPVSNGGVFATVGGERATFERCREVLECICDHVYWAGAPGSGQVSKLVRQYVSFVGFVNQMEGVLVAKKAGVDPEFILNFLHESVGINKRWWEDILSRDFGTPGTATATLDVVSKDISLALELARQVQAPASNGLAVDDLFQRAKAAGWGRYNWWVCIQLLESMAGSMLERTERE